MSICVYSCVCVVLCVGSGLETGRSPVQLCKIHGYRLIVNGNRPDGRIRQTNKKSKLEENEETNNKKMVIKNFKFVSILS
jgi:hypothetical protein